ncbi:glycerophosphoryl diester phosphodiesterase membrane domain-containing protein [Georgenia faecalis]|uniref:glycerophosphoryl diester phosphodiesterase membrane domain-containing protein n=1 Tax=Georgenia faecalis TaxID=2483799 RepID=UPI000FDB00E9|nr:glycerophosphoryl diester phosphodiesterase membrane domain-containing protein [Georgenia faecalis]
MSERPQERNDGPGGPPDPQYGQYGPPRPGAPAPDPQYGQYGAPAPDPQYGQYGAPATGYGQYGAPQDGGYFGPGFTQVPAAMQPGIIPLRPLTLGEIYDGAFRAIRTNPGVMFGLSAIVVALSTVIELVVVGAYLSDLESVLLSSSLSSSADLVDAFNPGMLAGALLASVVTGFATVVLTGLLILSVSESVIGRRAPIGEVWRRARGQVWRLLALTVLLWVGAMVLTFAGVFALAFLVAGLTTLAGDSVALAVIVTIVAFLALALLLAYLGVRTMLAPPAIMLERSHVFASIGRSWRLTRGHFWRLLGIMLLTLVLLGILQGILTVPFSIVGSLGGAGDVTWPLILSVVGQSVVSAVAIPFVAAVLALLYIDVRMRTEALDVELARAAQGS